MTNHKEVKLSKESREFIEAIYNPDIALRQLDELCKIRQRQNRIKIIINTDKRGIKQYGRIPN